MSKECLLQLGGSLVIKFIIGMVIGAWLITNTPLWVPMANDAINKVCNPGTFKDKEMKGSWRLL